MGGVVSPVTKVLGLKRQDGGSGTVADQMREAAAPKPAAPAAATVEAREAGEDKAARRRSRRRGQGLLSEARVNPEQGISTLGTTGL